MENLHFIPNNIITKFFKELIKDKNGYQQYLNYTYKSYIIHLIAYMGGFRCSRGGSNEPPQLGKKKKKIVYNFF